MGMPIMKSELLEITEIHKKTQAKMFKDLKVGDTIQLSTTVKAPGSNRGTYATVITAKNVKTGECVFKTFNEISPILKNFEFKEWGY